MGIPYSIEINGENYATVDRFSQQQRDELFNNEYNQIYDDSKENLET